MLIPLTMESRVSETRLGLHPTSYQVKQHDVNPIAERVVWS